jgi:ribonuclease Z
MFEIVFLGTSGFQPTATRGLPALMVLHEDERFLIDCGEGTQRQLIRSGLGLRRLRHVFLTHQHLDHLLGLGGLAASLAEAPEPSTLTIHAGREARALAEKLVREVVLPETNGRLAVRFETLAPGQRLGGHHLGILAVPVHHRSGESFGFLFEEPAHRPLDSAKLEALGVPDGPARRTLAKGMPVTLPDGRRLSPDQVAAAPRAGARLLVIGDAEETRTLLPYAQGVDGLVIEATYLEQDRAKARAHGHLTAAEAARFAREAGVRSLFLTHCSGRYQGPELLAEAQAYHSHVVLAEDLARARVAAAEKST